MSTRQDGSTPQRVRLLVVDDEHLVRAGLRLVLDGAAGIEVIGDAGDGAQALRLATELSPDVILMDIRMPGTDGITATRALREAATGRARPAVIMLTAFDTDDFILDALDAGAVGFLLKDTPPPQLVAAVLAAAAGDLRFSPAVLGRLVDLAGRHRRRPCEQARRSLAALTDRERDVALAVAEGLTNAEIGQALHLSLPTVKTHLGRVFDKLMVSNRVQLALLIRDADLS